MSALPCGSWPSPISAADAARHDGAPNWPAALGEEVWWTEPRPREGGRVALCRTRLDDPAAAPQTVLPAPWNARSRVHEYGGRPFVLVPGAAGAAVVFTEFTDQRLYLFEPGGEPRPLTPEPAEPAAVRYVEPVLAPGGTEVWCVCERRTGPLPTDVRRSIVAVPLAGCSGPDDVREVAAGHRFLACPRVSPDGAHLSWIGWDHPDMPWDSTRLLVAGIGPDGRAARPEEVAGGPGVSVVQAEWADDTTLYCVADPEGWWNPYRVSAAPGGGWGRPEALVRCEEEFGGPLWQLGYTWLLPLPGGRLAAVHGRALTSLGVLDTATGALEDAATPHTEWLGRLAAAGRDGRTVLGVAAAADLAPEVVAVAPDGSWRSLSRPRPAGAPAADGRAAYLPRPRTVEFSGPDGREVHAVLYPPHNPAAEPLPGELPPYVVWAHGGPTSRAPMVLDTEIAYFTSRGIGVVEVNYGGSTGFGRAYRERLRGNWGVVDVADCVAAAEGLVARGLADPRRLAIRGGSAGGWTSVAALAFTDTFRCAAILFPIVDLVGWRTGETHDFESQYLESLVGPWPRERRRYTERSPVNAADRISAPFVLMQGLEDEICPPVQCERLLAQVRDVPHAYLAFEGEQHGFRRAETITAALHAELSLYAQVFGFASDAPKLELHR
ncbi:prolyl oligopeptidase family serine peptidase [Streptomonospora nanhaiensis]|uniref:Dipeptidyl aminopeptidase/acylaminoacyl peptidase n=1 Tax=Streptomonospora nanhaiensis TaxID=1323731 RepID=A0A853BK38_9ACTN|nr:prolyl oligopeptidase family serine peptidase [Streptomonospora nanhaiensis]MBV2362348.1 prolyl oligopeptidase family serine peptidase [Streptomonospora nanhaiensis]MBX9391334.1 prolyl oligopeptidase family serine peptidase [Streptomonospora nanhaiensis]NYI94997.1 dipeptidyl aminopeptidase/acylaminoacyl peptidase [Streptomonospora nanhaiensis]